MATIDRHTKTHRGATTPKPSRNATTEIRIAKIRTQVPTQNPRALSRRFMSAPRQMRIKQIPDKNVAQTAKLTDAMLKNNTRSRLGTLSAPFLTDALNRTHWFNSLLNWSAICYIGNASQLAKREYDNLNIVRTVCYIFARRYLLDLAKQE